MERVCEFCMSLRPVVYCKSDAAHLCLLCDAKVHSANALSNRHPRTLVCESCSDRPAYIRCSDDQMFMCRGCDRSHHDITSQHQRAVISTYMGCPSAKELAALWGFDLNEMDSSLQSEFVPTSDLANNTGMVASKVRKHYRSRTGGTSSEVSSITAATKSIRQQDKAFGKSNHPGKPRLILQQIIDLERLHLNEANDISSLKRGREQTDISLLQDDALWTLPENLDKLMKQSLVFNPDLQHANDPNEELTVEPLPSPFSQLDNLNNVDNSLPAETFWHCRSPVQADQLWSQNMQDLGICDEPGSFDDLHIPDFDLTFRNFDEMFGDEKDPVRELTNDIDTTCSYIKKNLSNEEPDDGDQHEAVSAASFACIKQQSANCDKVNISASQNHHYPESRGFLRQFRPPYSTSSFPLSRLSAESSHAEYKEGGFSPGTRQELLDNSPDLELVQVNGEENVMKKYKENKNVRRHEKSTRYKTQRSKSNVNKCSEGQSVTAESYESDTISVARSF